MLWVWAVVYVWSVHCLALSSRFKAHSDPSFPGIAGAGRIARSLHRGGHGPRLGPRRWWADTLLESGGLESEPRFPCHFVCLAACKYVYRRLHPEICPREAQGLTNVPVPVFLVQLEKPGQPGRWVSAGSQWGEEKRFQMEVVRKGEKRTGVIQQVNTSYLASRRS